MRKLHLLPREAVFQMQVKADQRKHDADRLRRYVGMLRRERIHRELVNKCRIAVRQRVKRKLVKRIHIREHVPTSKHAHRFHHQSSPRIPAAAHAPVHTPQLHVIQ